MKKVIILLSCMHGWYVQCIPPLEQLRPFFELAHTGDQSATALCKSVIAVHISELKNRLLYSDNLSERSFLKTLFHVNIGGEFVATRHEPYTFLTPQSIAWLMHWSEQNTGIEKIEDRGASPLIKTFAKQENLDGKITRLKKLMIAVSDPNNTVRHKALLAFLYVKATSVEDLQQYLIERALLKADLVPSEVCTRSVWTEQQYQEYCAWAQTCTKKSESNQHVQRYLQHNEPLIAWCKLKDRGVVFGLPPKVYYDDAKPGNVPLVRDCCESVLQELVNRLVYHQQRFDTSRVTTMSQQCKDFYAQHAQAATVAQINNSERRSAWMRLVSNISGAEYRKKQHDITYEVHPSVQNFLHILNHIFNLQCGELSELCAAISQNNTVVLHFNSQKTEKRSDTDADLVFDLNLFDNQKRQFTVHIRTDHTWITDQNQSLHVCKTFDNDFVSNEQRLVDSIGNTPTALTPLFAFALPVDKITDQEQQKTAVLSNSTNTEQQKYIFLQKLLSCLKDNPSIVSSVVSVMESLHQQEYIKNCLMRCIERGVHGDIDVKKIILKKAPQLKPEYKQHILLCLAEHGFRYDPEYCILMEQLIKEIPDKETSDTINETTVSIDTKVITLARLLQLDLVNNPTLMHALWQQIDTLSQDRKDTLLRLVNELSLLI